MNDILIISSYFLMASFVALYALHKLIKNIVNRINRKGLG